MKVESRKICSFILFLLPVLGLQAQVSALLEADSSHLYVGDPLTLRLHVNHPPGTLVEEPVVELGEEGKQLEVLGASRWDTVARGNEILLQKELVVTAWDTGFFLLPAVQLPFSGPGGRDTARTDPFPLEVRSVQTDSVFVAPNKAIVREPWHWKDALPWLIGLGSLALAVLAGWLFVRWRRLPAEPPPAAPERIRPPHEIALEKLTGLESRKLWQQGQIKEYHSELTYILREYLENRFGIQALEQTTREILQQLGRLGLASDVQAQLRELLQTADLVKFAKAQPPAEFHPRVLQQVRELIEQTKPAPPAPEETNES